MKKISDMGWRRLGAGVAVSIVLHLVVAAILLVHLPSQTPVPEQEQAVNVELVPPPEDKTPDEKKPEEKPPEEKKEEAQKPPEKPPEQPPEPQKTQEPPAPAPPPAPPAPPPPAPEPPKPPEEKPKLPEKPPEEKKPEEKPPEQKPPEEKPPEQKPPEEKPPEEKPPEQKPPEEAPKEEAQKEDPPKAQDPPITTLRPVFKFGDKDAGPKKSEDGDSASGDATPDDVQPTDDAAAQPAQDDPAATPPVDPPSADSAAAGEPPADSADQPANDSAAADAASDDKAASASPMPQGIDLPKVGASATNPAKDGPKSVGSGDASVSLTVEPPKADSKDPTAPSKTGSKSEQPVKLTRAKKIYSRSDSGDGVATTAMDGLPRGIRAGQLCATELQQQLEHTAAQYHPQLVPAYALPSGTVLQVTRGAFRADGRWYNLSFRCEIDADATKVNSFSFDVGAPVPKSEWKSRRLTDN